MRVVEKADMGVLASNANFQRIDKLSCDVAPKAGAVGFSSVETSVVA